MSNTTLGILFICIAMLGMSLNDVFIKMLAGDYPLHQMVLARSGIGIFFSFALVQLQGGWANLLDDVKHLRFGWQALRAVLLIASNLMYFCAVAVMPLAEVTAIFFAAPLMITLLSIPVLNEKVGPYRLSAVVVGFLGVVIMQKPWADLSSEAVQRWVYLLPLAAAFLYAVSQIVLRKIPNATKASVTAVYTQIMFILITGLIWAGIGDGQYFAEDQHASLQFVFRPWAWPQGNDWWPFIGLGLTSAIIGFGLAMAYKKAQAATIAPFEYIGLPLAVFFGWFFFAELPGPEVAFGIVLILGSGLFVWWRERTRAKQADALTARR